MKHLTMADKSLLVGTEAADLLMRYAALLAQINRGDTVVLSAIGIDGEPVDVTFLLNSGTVILAETSRSVLPEPDNRAAADYMRTQIDSYAPMGAAPERTDDAPEQA